MCYPNCCWWTQDGLKLTRLEKLERSRNNEPVPHTAATSPSLFPYAKNLTNSIRVAIQICSLNSQEEEH
jgi:hypothetical protein